MDFIEKAVQTHDLTHAELVEILGSSHYDEALWYAADKMRQNHVGNDVHLKGLLEFSNICSRTCYYCGLRAENRSIKRYKLSAEEIRAFAKKAISYGYKTIVLQSGESHTYDCQTLCDIIASIRSLGATVTLSLGEKSKEEYQAYKEAGANRYLLRIETTDKALYASLHPRMSFENRLNCLYTLKALGYETGSGSLIGLPNQSIDSLANDLLFFKNFDFDMIGIGPFIPSENTPLAHAKGGSFTMALKMMALVRLLLPKINIPATTAMETLDSNGRTRALQSGANVVMPVITEGEYRALYRLYPGKICIDDTPKQCRLCISGKIIAIGRGIASNNGDSERFIARKEEQRRYYDANA
ncbi:MAG: [FeFe] hydrogenase H-cluster radical SAM maturase HydE [Epsilonproteobacteria bacterium]|nr:[FeFe] hydrogenase H-cluster radical SAM maturase HydE [Campylobacterota bacterium]